MRPRHWYGRPDKVRVVVDLDEEAVLRVRKLGELKGTEPGRIIEIAVGLLWVSVAEGDRMVEGKEVERAGGSDGRDDAAGPLGVEVVKIMRKVRRRSSNAKH